jgi:hypothetical protein
LLIFEAKLDVDPVSHFRSWITGLAQDVFEGQFFRKLIRALIKKSF